MWLSKFVDLKDDIEGLRKEIKDKLFKNRNKKEITPLEFTVLEHIFNYKEISGYDLIQTLNRHFAGTWEAKSGTIYPLLSKLAKNGFLKSKKVKSPIGPLKTVYFLTDAGQEILKKKVKGNFAEQMKFIENFIIELSSIYINAFEKEEQTQQIQGVQQIIRDMFTRIAEKIPLGVEFKMKCSNCNAEMERSNAAYCSLCGAELHAIISGESEQDPEDDEFAPTENLNGVA